MYRAFDFVNCLPGQATLPEHRIEVLVDQLAGHVDLPIEGWDVHACFLMGCIGVYCVNWNGFEWVAIIFATTKHSAYVENTGLSVQQSKT